MQFPITEGPGSSRFRDDRLSQLLLDRDFRWEPIAIPDLTNHINLTGHINWDEFLVVKQGKMERVWSGIKSVCAKVVALVKRVWAAVVGLFRRGQDASVSLHDMDAVLAALRAESLSVEQSDSEPEGRLFLLYPLGTLFLHKRESNGQPALEAVWMDPCFGAVERQTFTSFTALRDRLQSLEKTTQEAIARLRTLPCIAHAPERAPGQLWRDVLTKLQQDGCSDDEVFLAWDQARGHFYFLHPSALDSTGFLPHNQALLNLSPVNVKTKIESAIRRLALRELGVVWLQEDDRCRIVQHFNMKERPSDFVAIVGFGDPERASTLSLFSLERDENGTPTTPTVKEIPIGRLTDMKRELSGLKDLLRTRAAARTVAWNEELRELLGEDFRMDTSVAVTSQDFEGNSDAFVVVHEGADEYSIHAHYNGQVAVTRMTGPVEKILRKAQRWVFEKSVWPALQDWIGQQPNVGLLPSGDQYPGRQAFLNDAGTGVVHDLVFVRLHESGNKFDLFSFSPVTHTVERMNAPPGESVESYKEFITTKLRRQRAVAAQQDAGTDDIVRQSFPSNFVEATHEVTAADFEGRPTTVFFLKTHPEGGYAVYTRSSGSGAPSSRVVTSEDPAHYPRRIARYLLCDFLGTFARNEFPDNLYWADQGSTIERGSFIMGDGECFEIDRMFLQPDTEARHFWAYTLNPDTAEPVRQPIALNEIHQIRERSEDLCGEALVNYFCALENVKERLGDRLWEGEENAPEVSGLEFRVALRPLKLQIEVFFRDPLSGKVRGLKGVGLSTAVVDATIANALENLQQAGTFSQMVTAVEHAMVSPHNRNPALDDGWEGAHPLRVVVRATEDYSAFTLYYRDPEDQSIFTRQADSLETLQATIRGTQEHIRSSTGYVLNDQGLGIVSRQGGLEIPPPPAGVSVRELKALAENLIPLVGKPSITFSVTALERIQRKIDNYVSQVESQSNLNGFNPERRRDAYGNIFAMALHIVKGLKEKNDPELTFSVLKSLSEASGNCGSRYLSATTHEYMTVFDQWDRGFADHWEERVRLWLDQLKMGTIHTIIANCRLEHPTHSINYMVKALDDVGIKVPPTPEIDFNDQYINSVGGSPFRSPAEAVRRFKKAFKQELVDTIQARTSEAMNRDGPFSRQIIDVLQKFVEDHRLTDEDRLALDEARTEYERNRVRATRLATLTHQGGEEAEAERLKVSDQFTSAKSGILHHRMMEEELVDYVDEDLTQVAVTPQGTRALLQELNVLLTLDAGGA